MLVTRTFLQQLAPADIVPAVVPEEPVEITRVSVPAPEFSRFLYATVGEAYYWTDRLDWSWQRWQDWVTQPGFESWVCWSGGAPAGYAELLGSPGEQGTEVKLAYFGLLPAFTGRGLGGHLLTTALRRAWSLSGRHPDFPPVSRVWLHTCTLDGERALPNYKARGLHPYRSEQYERELTRPTGPWPGAFPGED
ncbi:GNAT family N-acetyltransferase [Sciscionella marina]|uniref:GNAT family N-acetyltransferase n=1 Tax=Sciscionella marina TaxID=508770 RepID=UPI0003790ED3|nr:GNAT family N-acetyltransferase [Sciscionella marina]